MDEIQLLHDTYRYDPKTGDLWFRTPGRGRRTSQPVGSIQPSGHRKAYSFDNDGNKKSDYAHRIIWKMHNGPIPAKMTIDHIDGDPDNNRLENLRLATQHQQMMNRKGYKRYHFQKTLGYSTTVTCDGIGFQLGYFDTKEECLHIHKRASVTLFREFSFFYGEVKPFDDMKEFYEYVIRTTVYK